MHSILQNKKFLIILFYIIGTFTNKKDYGEAHDTRDHHTRTIAYPIWICCPDEKDSLPQLTRHFDGVSGCPVPCHGFQRTLLNLGLLW